MRERCDGESSVATVSGTVLGVPTDAVQQYCGVSVDV